MTINRTRLIEVGDVVINYKAEQAHITQVTATRYGLFLRGILESGYEFGAFAPYELPPPSQDTIDCHWYNWAGYWGLTTSRGIRIGAVDWWRDAPWVTPEDADRRWEETVRQMRVEELVDDLYSPLDD